MPFTVIFSALLIFSSQAQASDTLAPVPLITKVNQSGYTPVDYRYSEVCEVYRTRVVVTTKMGIENTETPVVMRRVFPVVLSANIREMIRQASVEQLQDSDIQLCDANTTKVTAASTDVPSFVLFRSGSCSESRAERMGGSSHQLRKIVDGFCPETNDPGGDSGSVEN